MTAGLRPRATISGIGNVIVRPPVGCVERIVDARQRELLLAVGNLEQLLVVELGRAWDSACSDFGSMGNSHSGTAIWFLASRRGGRGIGGAWAMARSHEQHCPAEQADRRSMSFPSLAVRIVAMGCILPPCRAFPAEPCQSKPLSWRATSLANTWCTNRRRAGLPGASSRPRHIRPETPPATRAPD